MKSIEERIKDAEARVERLKAEELRTKVHAGARFRSGSNIYMIIHVHGTKCWWQKKGFKDLNGITDCSAFLAALYTKIEDAK